MFCFRVDSDSVTILVRKRKGFFPSLVGFQMIEGCFFFSPRKFCISLSTLTINGCLVIGFILIRDSIFGCFVLNKC